VGLCLIDEAHLRVIEEWGSDFLPDFERLHNSVLFFCLRQSFAPTATAPQKRTQYFKENLQIKNSVVNVRHLDRCNIFICKEKGRSSTYGHESYDILIPIAEDLKVKLTSNPLTIIYLALKWCGYAFKLFLSVLGEKFLPVNEEDLTIATLHNIMLLKQA